MTDKKVGRPKGWKRGYTFPRKSEMARMKEVRMAYLESEEHARNMEEIRRWNRAKQER
ncbi:MAG: hypothetical protein QXL94_01705 [Candidatus Parvarchaeum sp.]